MGTADGLALVFGLLAWQRADDGEDVGDWAAGSALDRPARRGPIKSILKKIRRELAAAAARGGSGLGHIPGVCAKGFCLRQVVSLPASDSLGSMRGWSDWFAWAAAFKPVQAWSLARIGALYMSITLGGGVRCPVRRGLYP